MSLCLRRVVRRDNPQQPLVMLHAAESDEDDAPTPNSMSAEERFLWDTAAVAEARAAARNVPGGGATSASASPMSNTSSPSLHVNATTSGAGTGLDTVVAALQDVASASA